MGIQMDAAFTDETTGIVLTGAHASFKASAITIDPDPSGIYTLSAAAGIWKDEAAKTSGKAPLTYVNVIIRSSPDAIGKTGVYNQLYAELKTMLPAA